MKKRFGLLVAALSVAICLTAMNARSEGYKFTPCEDVKVKITYDGPPI
jgi:hypothetical protein